MKKTTLFCLCLFLCLISCSARAVYYATPEAKTIAIREFDTIYPGLTQEMKDNIWISYVSGGSGLAGQEQICISVQKRTYDQRGNYRGRMDWRSNGLP